MATSQVIPSPIALSIKDRAGKPRGEREPSLGEIPQELQDKLKAPLPPEAITSNDKHSHLSSIKPAYVIERMNEVFGIGGYAEHYREISMTTRKETWNKGKQNEREVTLFVATVHGTLTIPKYGVHLENFGGSENENAGDELKGACTDAFTKMCSHLGIGLEVYKGVYDKPRESRESLPPCPACGKTLRKSKNEDEGYYCWTKKDGCGATFTEEGLRAAIASKSRQNGNTPDRKKAPASADRPTSSIDSTPKINISAKITEVRMNRESQTLHVQVGDRDCATKTPEIWNRFAGKKGHVAELVVSEIKRNNQPSVWQIHRVISIMTEREAAGHETL